MKFRFPNKSLFGFKVLNSLQSTIAAYLLLIIFIIIEPLMGEENIQLIARALFTLIINASIIILILNSMQQKNTTNNNYWKIFNFPLWFFMPISLIFSIKALKILITSM